MTRPARGARLIVLVIAVAVTSCSSGGGGDDGGGGGGGGDGTSIGAFNFNQANMEYAAGIAARVVDTFPPVADLLIATFVALRNVNMISGVARALPGCALGTASLLWTDASGDGAWSVGDTARVDLNGCQVHPYDMETLGGSFTLTFSSVSRGPPLAIAAVLEMALTTQGSQAGTIAGKVTLTATSSDGQHFALMFQPSGTGVVTATGSAPFEFGCFDVRDDPHPAEAYARRIAVTGVIKALSKIMSIDPGGKLLYASDDVPGDGRIGLLSFSSPECAALGVGQGVGDSDFSTLTVSAKERAKMQLDLYGGQTLIASTTKAWLELLFPAAPRIINGTNVMDVASMAYDLDFPRKVGALGLDLVVGRVSGNPVALCKSGGYAVTISPASPLAAGHVATTTYNGCVAEMFGDTVTLGGTATFTVVEVTGDPASGTYSLITLVASNGLTVTTDVGPMHIVGAFSFERDAAGGDVTELSESQSGLSLGYTQGSHQASFDEFSVRAARSSTSFTMATAGDEMRIADHDIAGALHLDVSTTITGSADGPPSAGDLKLTANDGTSVGLHFATGGAVTLSLDSNGDGVTDATIQTTWDEID